MPRRKKTTEAQAAPRPGHNGANPVNFVERVERLHSKLLEERSEYMLRCKAVRADVSSVLDEAREAGIARRSLKAVLKARALEAKADAVREDLEAEDQQSYDNIRVALGDFANLPLGEAALRAASQRFTPPDTSDHPFGVPPQ